MRSVCINSVNHFPRPEMRLDRGTNDAVTADVMLSMVAEGSESSEEIDVSESRDGFVSSSGLLLLLGLVLVGVGALAC